jgi:general secretion pathway protein J
MMARARRNRRGLTLLEVLVVITILSMISVLIYGAFDGLSRSKTGLARINGRYQEGRSVMRRLAEEISGAFLTTHQPLVANQIVRKTIFALKDTSPADRLDLTTFSHRRVTANSRESDQNELSYFGAPDPNVSGKVDLVRREQTIIDFDPNKGGQVMVMAEDIDLFDLKLLDPQSGTWTDSWDTTQATGQPNRLPIQVRITLVLRGGPGGKPIRFEEKVTIPMIEALSFAQPR